MEILSMRLKVAILSRWMANIMSILKMLVTQIIFVPKTKSRNKNKNTHQIVAVQVMKLLLPEHKVDIQLMTVTSLILQILLKIQVTLISFLMVAIIITFLRVLYLQVNWLPLKLTLLEEEVNKV